MYIAKLVISFAFDPRAYLATYYADKPEQDYGEDASLYWFHRAYTDLAPSGTLLEFGGGPTVYALITAAAHVEEIHFSDILEVNLDAVRQWKQGQGHDWSHYIRRALELASLPADHAGIEQRAELLRQKITEFHRFDQHVPPAKPDAYDVLSVQFVPDSSLDRLDDFRACTRNILGYLKPGGLLMMGVLRRTHAYRVGASELKAIYLTEEAIEVEMEQLGITILRMASFATYDKTRGVGGYIYFAGRKTTASNAGSALS